MVVSLYQVVTLNAEPPLTHFIFRKPYGMPTLWMGNRWAVKLSALPMATQDNTPRAGLELSHSVYRAGTLDDHSSTSSLWKMVFCACFSETAASHHNDVWINSISPETGMRACVLSHFSCVPLFETLWAVDCQALPVHGILQARILGWVAMPSSRSNHGITPIH